MSSTLLPPKGNDDQNDVSHKDLKSKKEKIIQPISENKSALPDIPGASNNLLEELRAKTAKLAEEIKDSDVQESKMLVIEDNEKPKNSNVKISTKQVSSNANPAVELVRNKLAKIYKKEPDAAEEAIEAYQAGKLRSKHQQFMYELTTSGKSLADIQTEWHNYYSDLSEDEKHQVWNEFYESQNRYANKIKSEHKSKIPTTATIPKKKPQYKLKDSTSDPRTTGEIKSQILDKISAGGKLKPVHHAKSLLFGLGLAGIVGLIISFTFFNEVFVAPFISPSKSVSATPIIGAQSGPVGPEPIIIIPKINLEVPVVFGLGSIEESDIQNALEEGVVHYSTTPYPGEQGNSVIVGHSSNNILNSGKYKFAFVLLKRLEVDDTFFVHKDGVRYTYKVYKKEVVAPTDVSVLGEQDKANTMTLITCDPPGTSINRLIITGEQISPDPSENTTSSSAINATEAATEELPSNAPSLWSRIWPF